MPMPTSKLSKDSSNLSVLSVRAAISSCLRIESQYIALCLADAQKHAGSRFLPSNVKVKE